MGVNVSIYGNIEAELYQIIQVDEIHDLKIYKQDIIPEWFGFCSYQLNLTNFNPDDRIIQKAINAASTDGGIIVFNGKNYNINQTVIIPSIIRTIKLAGKDIGYYSAQSSTNNINVINEELSIVFNIKSEGATVTNLNFSAYNNHNVVVNKGSDSKGIALNIVMEDGRKDIDPIIRFCKFSGFRNGIFVRGANLRCTDNLFVGNYIGVNIKQANLHVHDQAAQTRGHVIDRNRFHSLGSYRSDNDLIGSTCVKILHDIPFQDVTTNPDWQWTVYGYYNQITNNYADDCKTFFEGSIDRTKINNNTILTSGGTAIKVVTGAYGVISNNLIDGSFTWNPHKLFPTNDETIHIPIGHGIHVNFANFLNIHNNTINNKRFHGIYMEKSKNTSIQSNTIMNFNRYSYVRHEDNDVYETMKYDSIIYDGIHIACTEKTGDPLRGYNIQNVVANNHISLPFSPLGDYSTAIARYGIYVGDGDEWGFVKDNFIISARMEQTIKIESPTQFCR